MNEQVKKPALCIVSSYEFKDTNATKARLGAYIDVLQHSFNITFLCPDDHDKAGLDSVKVHNLGRTPVRGGFIIRAVREFFYAIRAGRRLRAIKPDIALVTSPSMFLLMLASRKPCPAILDIRDLTWEYLSDSSLFQRTVKSLFRRLAIRQALRADLITVTNEDEYEYFTKILNTRASTIPVKIVRNGISRQRFERMSAIPDERVSTNLTLLYVGNVGIAQDLTTLVDAMKHHPELTANIVGAGSDLERVRNYAEQARVTNIEFIGGVPWDTLMEYYAGADLLYAQITASFESAIPSKLYEYLTVGVPVIYGGCGVGAEFVRQFKNVEVVEPGNANALAAAIERASKLTGQPRDPANANRIHEKYLRENQIEAVAPMLRALAD